MKPTASLPSALTTHAADWLARRDAGFTPADAAAFEAWLAADPRHAAAVAELESAWSLLQRPRAAGEADRVLADLAARARLRHQRRARRFTTVATTLAAAAAIALAIWLPSLTEKNSAPAPSAVATATPRPERQLLDDGSIVELNVGAALSVAFTPTRRSVTLLRGEAHFAVAKDPARPFVVTANGVEARAVGTEFTVTLAAQNVSVLVTEGRVAVAPPPAPASSSAAPAAPVIVDAGSRAIVPLAATAHATPSLDPVTPAQIASALAWRPKRLEFTGTPLADAIALFNRQNTLQLTLADPSLGVLRVSGIFWADDPAGFARLIEPTFSLRTRALSPARIEISR